MKVIKILFRHFELFEFLRKNNFSNVQLPSTFQFAVKNYVTVICKKECNSGWTKEIYQYEIVCLPSNIVHLAKRCISNKRRNFAGD